MGRRSLPSFPLCSTSKLLASQALMRLKPREDKGAPCHPVLAWLKERRASKLQMKHGAEPSCSAGPAVSHLHPVTSISSHCLAARNSNGALLGQAVNPGIFVFILNQLSIQNQFQLPPRGKQLQDT